MIYKNEFLNEISFPLGGIGTGCIGLTGSGRLQDFEIFNRPAKATFNGYSGFTVKAVKDGKAYVKALCGDHTKDLIGTYQQAHYRGYGFGPLSSTFAGFPHFKDVTFKGEFPVAELTFKDSDFPCDVKLRAFNPFIPLDSFNSSIPCAIFEIELTNDTESDIEFTSFFSFRNPFGKSRNEKLVLDNAVGVKMLNAGAENGDVSYGDLTAVCPDGNAFAQKYWYRGSWSDGIVTYWNEITSGGLRDRNYDTDGSYDHCSLCSTVKIEAAQTKKCTFVLTWNVPNNYNYWAPLKDENGKDVTWKNYYATVFENSVASAKYVISNFCSLKEKTFRYRDELFASTLDRAVIDAVSSTVSVIKSPTVFRLENGEFYGFEGVHERAGSCEGTCQHVWNYAYALCFLFPDLERSIRDVEEKYATASDGRTNFRVKLPLGRDMGDFRACLDGQMGSVIKIYREWKICGDRNWLENKWETVVKILEYAWSEDNPDCWDRDKDGVLEGRQHHTLDMELFGPSSWLQSFYLAALKAASEMALYLGHEAKAKEYTELFEKGKAWSDENLFNGEYFIQKIDLSDKSLVERFNGSGDALHGQNTVDAYWNAEQEEIKYQIGQGCEIDQMCGQWHSNIVGLGDIFDKEKVRIALKNVYKNNYKSSMRGFTNPWRIFALNDEAATVICDYPEGKYKPFIPIPYCEESMNGFEYQIGGLLISEGYIKEGLDVVKGVRDRYNGSNRNPWNEIECGSNYARSMASFALLPIFSGFIFDMPNKKIGFAPIEDKDYFRCIWSLDAAFGNVEYKKESIKVNIVFGKLPLKELVLPKLTKKPKKLVIDGIETKFDFKDGALRFTEQPITETIEVII